MSQPVPPQVRPATIADPETRTLEAHANDGGAWRPAGRWQGEGEVVAPPFATVGWPLASLWG